MTSIVVTGTNSGMGLGFIKELVKRPDVNQIFATVRDPKSSASAELRKVAEGYPGRIHLIPLELTEKSAAVIPHVPSKQFEREKGLIKGCCCGGEERVGG